MSILSKKQTEISPESVLSINPSTFLTGVIQTKNSIRIEGRVNGVLLSENKIVITQGAYINGDVYCKELVCSGEVEGNILCKGRITLKSNAKINGKIYTYTFENEENSHVLGAINLINSISEESSIFADLFIDKYKDFFKSPLLNKELSSKMSSLVEVKLITEKIATAPATSKKD
ncbi:MAG: polymer-forming cytoskeletal protein [Flavobacterium sp.]|nr:polymer-forming cytoskeletal protein [Flavobacterium sp.]